VFDTLLESGAKRQGSLGQTVFSVVFHVVLIYGAIEVTRSTKAFVQGIMQDTTIMFLTPPPPPPPPPPPEMAPPPTVVVTTTPPPQGFQTVVPPTEIPTTIPPIDLKERFDARDFSGRGVEGGIATGVIGGIGVVPTTTEAVTGETFLDSQVDDPVVQINRPQPRYPPVLQQAGISGRVELEYVVGTDGRVEVGTIKVLSSTNSQFEAPAIDAIRRATFKPAKIRGQAVRQLVRQAITFTIG